MWLSVWEWLLPHERLWSVPQLAKEVLAPLSTDCIRDHFIDLPGVLIIYKKKKGYRRKRMLLVPDSVLRRWLDDHTNGGQP
jgi:hypothetical protein